MLLIRPGPGAGHRRALTLSASNAQIQPHLPREARPGIAATHIGSNLCRFSGMPSLARSVTITQAGTLGQPHAPPSTKTVHQDQNRFGERRNTLISAYSSAKKVCIAWDHRPCADHRVCGYRRGAECPCSPAPRSRMGFQISLSAASLSRLLPLQPAGHLQCQGIEFRWAVQRQMADYDFRTSPVTGAAHQSISLSPGCKV